MSNQTYTKRMKNAAKMRRGSLANKTATYVERGVGTVVFYFFAALAVVFFVGWFQSMVYWGVLMFSLVCAAIAAAGLLVQQKGFKKAQRLEYVPPVRGRIATLS